MVHINTIGLADGDEVAHGNDHMNPDSDGDGILDGDELTLGTNPLKKDEIARVFQSLDGSDFTIEGYAPFVLFREGVAAAYGVDSFLKNPALVGTPIEIRLPDGGDLTLKLTVKSGAKEIAVFRMNGNGTVRLDAQKSGETFSVALDENGVYYAADLQKLGALLGLTGGSVQSVPENSYLLEDFRTVTLSAPLLAGSDVDTDGDGIPDCEEIGEQYAIDLGNGYTATVYGYVSDPTLVDSDFDGIRDDLDTLPRSNNFSATYKSGDFTINLTYSMDYRDFLGDNTVYNAAIASFSVWAAQLAYDNDITFTPGETLYDSDGSVITNARRIDTLMRAHGMQNVIDYQLENGYFDSDVSLGAYSDDNITEVFFGHHKVADDDGKEYEIITVFVRGTNGTEKEWCSNFDVGDLHRFLDDYDCVEGKNPRQLNADWNRKSNHRGFDMCATRIYRALAAYMNKFVDSEATPIFWLAGHSRGAAIANIVSASCIDEGHKIFAYTYASPNTTANTEASAAKYDCIFNLINGDDFVPMLPMPEWGFTRYGRSATIAAHNASSSQRSSILNTTSYSYSDDLGSLVAKFTNMTKNNNNVVEGWWDVYVYHCKSSDTVGSYHTHNGETVGEYRDGSRKSYFTDSNWNDYNEHTKKYSYCIRDGNGWINKYSCCQTPAYAMQLLAITMGNLGLSAGWDFLTSYDLADRFDFGKMSLITNYATKIADPHYMENYYLIQKALLSNPDTTFNTNNSLYTNASHRPQHTHSYEIVEIKQAPTCTEPGVAHVICRCSQVNSAWYDDEIKNALIPATGHNYGTPAWTWDGLTEATATFTCANDGTHVETRSTTDIVRTENGDLAVYTATVEFEGQTYTDTKEVEIGYYLIGSMTDWEVDETYRFTANAAAEGEYLLNVADLAVGAEIKVVRAEGATKLNWYPDYGGNYTVDYPHSGNVNVYFRPAGNVWNDFFTGGYFYISRLHTAEVIAVGGGEASLDPASPDVTATVTVVVPANAGYHYNYVEIYKRTGAGENDLEQIELGSLDWNDTNRTFTMPDYDVVIKVYFAAHTWSEPTYTWEAEGEGWKCTATRECTTEGCDAVETETVTAVRTETADKAVYTATFENEAFEEQVKEVEIGYYLVGSITDWAVDTTKKFAVNAENASEYMLAITLAADDEFKAVKAEGTTILTWYPDQGTNYVVGANQAGDVTVYFRPDGQGGDGWHYGYLYIAVPVLEEPAFMTQSLVLEGQIGVNFFVRLPQDARYTYTGVDFTIDNTDGADTSVAFSPDMDTNSNGYYRFTYYVRSIEMADTITATLKYTENGEDKTLEKTYSVKEYFATFDEYENQFDEKTKNLIKAVADFGHYVQAFLNTTRTWTIGVDYTEMDKFYTTYTAEDIEAAQTALAAYNVVKQQTADIEKITYTLVLDSSTELRVYFKPANGYTGSFSFTVNGAAAEGVLQADGRYMVSIKDIAAHHLSTVYTVSAHTTAGESSIELAALSYVNAMITSYASNELAVKAAVAIWRYSKYTDEYKTN